MTGYRLHHKFKTPHSPLISHRCQKEACTEIKGRIWALCSKIKLSVVIFYITFRTAYWKMFPLLGSLPPLPPVSFPFPILLSFLCLPFLLFAYVIADSHSLCTLLNSDNSRGALLQICLQTEDTAQWPSLSAQENIAYLYLHCHSWV